MTLINFGIINLLEPTISVLMETIQLINYNLKMIPDIQYSDLGKPDILLLEVIGSRSNKTK